MNFSVGRCKMDQLIRILEGICPGVDFMEEDSLIDDGLIDSLDIVAIVSEIMDEFGVEINVVDLVPDNFNSVDAIFQMIEKARS